MLTIEIIASVTAIMSGLLLIGMTLQAVGQIKKIKIFSAAGDCFVILTFVFGGIALLCAGVRTLI